MFKIPNISMWTDIISLPKEQLKDICNKLEISDKGTTDDLCERIWEKINGQPRIQLLALESSQKYLLGGRTSVTWFTLDGELTGLKSKIVSSLDYNPFEKMKIPEGDNITSEPVLISGAVGDTEDEYYLRFMNRVGTARHVYGNKISYTPQTSTTTVYFNEREKFIEVRSDPRKAIKVAQSLSRTVGQSINLEQVKVAAPFGNDAEAIADALEGELFDAKGKPDLLLEDFTEEHGKAVVEILAAIDDYFATEDMDALAASLGITKEKFGEQYSAVPFTALIVNGLEKVGMGVLNRDLRGMPLYDFLRPHLQAEGGYIQFRYNDGGVMKPYTIRIGLTSNSVQFVTPASEGVIDYVRKRLLVL
ncbi:hypothetical protein [Paenibacillus sp. FSL R5-808]|jgi:hypothetical protein|uniref:hypothetical protein n=1 Tax=Paenibacillus sp. FSL R5-808 TaxID=1227076 RepID=UPI0003E1D64E|nr:hypothetical protein [Paenibacillus sp. FSL R5-808]ETT33288.1 hypothetical protein C169_22870 [Paenibacillus sp. FSL R5-808]